MSNVSNVIEFLERFAPPKLAADWDNVGLLVGDRAATVERVMTCLTITPASAAEAVADRADLIVTHHPLPFRPLRRLSTDTTEGQLLWDLIRAGISIYSPHTAFDSAAAGINQRLAELLSLEGITPLVTDDAVDPTSTPDKKPAGTGRKGRLSESCSLEVLGERLKTALDIDGLHRVGQPNWPVREVAIACGAAGELFADAQRHGCQGFITGEMRFYDYLAAEAAGIGLLLVGHFPSERFAVIELAEVLATELPNCRVWASRRECDPLCWQ